MLSIFTYNYSCNLTTIFIRRKEEMESSDYDIFEKPILEQDNVSTNGQRELYDTVVSQLNGVNSENLRQNDLYMTMAPPLPGIKHNKNSPQQHTKQTARYSKSPPVMQLSGATKSNSDLSSPQLQNIGHSNVGEENTDGNTFSKIPPIPERNGQLKSDVIQDITKHVDQNNSQIRKSRISDVEGNPNVCDVSFLDCNKAMNNDEYNDSLHMKKSEIWPQTVHGNESLSVKPTPSTANVKDNSKEIINQCCLPSVARDFQRDGHGKKPKPLPRRTDGRIVRSVSMQSVKIIENEQFLNRSESCNELYMNDSVRRFSENVATLKKQGGFCSVPNDNNAHQMDIYNTSHDVLHALPEDKQQHDSGRDFQGDTVDLMVHQSNAPTLQQFDSNEHAQTSDMELHSDDIRELATDWNRTGSADGYICREHCSDIPTVMATTRQPDSYNTEGFEEEENTHM